MMLDNQLRSQIILYIIDPVYLATLRLPYVGIGTRTPLEIMAHLYTNYAKITPANLDNNDRAMKQPCHVNRPIEVLYQQIEDAIEFAAAGQTPYSPTHDSRDSASHLLFVQDNIQIHRNDGSFIDLLVIIIFKVGLSNI
jgi:hypothetical protein